MVEEGEDGAEDIGSKRVDRSFPTRGYSFSAALAGARSLHVVSSLNSSKKTGAVLRALVRYLVLPAPVDIENLQ
jgi:hypothetical protein